MLLSSTSVDKFRSGAGMSRSIYALFYGHPVVHKFHIFHSVIIKLSNSSTPRLPQRQNASTGCVKVKLYQESGSGIL